MPIYRTQTGNTHQLIYNPSQHEPLNTPDEQLAAWIGFRRSPHALDATVAMARVGLDTGHNFYARYNLDGAGQARQMIVRGFTRAVHTVVGVLISGETDTIIHKSIIYTSDGAVDDLYGENFAKPQAFHPHGADFINPPGAGFVFGGRNIITAIRTGLASQTPRQSLADELYADIYRTFQSNSRNSGWTDQEVSEVNQAGYDRPYLIDPDMPIYTPPVPSVAV